jgi:hypothetical protein
MKRERTSMIITGFVGTAKDFRIYLNKLKKLALINNVEILKK